MKWLSTPEFKVGAFVLVISGLVGAMSLRVSQDVTYLTGANSHHFILADANGLIKNSAIKIAGIDVGSIRDIELSPGGRAKVQVKIRRDVVLTKSTRVEVRPNGILGDKHIEIVPGSSTDPVLIDGEEIVNVDDSASLDRLVMEVSKISKSITAIAENVRGATEGDTSKPLGRILANMDRITTDLAEFTSKNQSKISDIVDNLRETTGTINDLVNDESEDGLRKGWGSAMRSMASIERSAKNIEEITGKINRGEGTIGKLINDEKTVENINTAIEGVNGFLDMGNKTSTAVDFHSHYLGRDASAKSLIGLRIQPGLDRYYELGIISDVKGVTENTVTNTSTNGGATSSTRESKRFENKIKFQALIAKNVYDFTLKGGIIENTGGIGIDYQLVRKILKVSLEAFDWDQVNVRAGVQYNIFHGFYLSAGAEDLALKTGTSVNGYVGAGLFLTNDDLKMLLTKLPF